MAPLSSAELLRLRMAALGLSGSRGDSPDDVARRGLAMQGQDFPGCLWALGLRSGADLVQVEAAFTSGRLVRSWPMRGTLHIVACEDLGWMLRLTSERLVGASLRRRWQQIGLDEQTVERARAVAVAALSGGRALARGALLDEFEAAGLVTSPRHRYHLVWYLSQTGTLVFGPIRDGEHLLVLSEEWITAPRHLGREESLAELAARYVASHGPATVEDLAWWCGLGKRAVTEGLLLARDRVARVVGEDGRTYWLSPDLSDQPVEEVLLLPAFDEHLLGYTDRTLVVSGAHASKLCPGGNGVFKPALVAGGVCAGTWKGTPPGALRKLPLTAPVPVGVTEFAASRSARVPRAALQEAADAYARYLGRPAAVVTLAP